MVDGRVNSAGHDAVKSKLRTQLYLIFDKIKRKKDVFQKVAYISVTNITGLREKNCTLQNKIQFVILQ